jgi:hypothetical protein
MASSTWWGPHLVGNRAWQLPDDLWGTLLAAQRLLHLDLGGLYTRPTGLVAPPGAAMILVPVVALIDAAGLGLASPGVHNSHPGSWLVAGPYETILSATALFAADAVAERLGVSRPKRALLAAVEAVALWNVSVEWGHPEDTVAVALLLYGVLALAESRTGRSAWLVGAAAAVQPLVLLALPLIVVVLEPRRLAGYLTKVAAPGAVVIGAALAANWRATLNSVVEQPNWPAVDHATPWTALAPHMGHGAVAAGPARAVSVMLACGLAVVLQRRWRWGEHIGDWPTAALEELLWWTAVALALRCVFESVMVAYYLWPVLAVSLVASVRRWSRLLSTAILASGITFVSQVSWHGHWAWWSVMVAGLILTLCFARGAHATKARPGTPALGARRELAVVSSQGSHDSRLRNST